MYVSPVDTDEINTGVSYISKKSISYIDFVKLTVNRQLFFYNLFTQVLSLGKYKERKTKNTILSEQFQNPIEKS